ncbi:MAG TPA: Ldh family oxidoreductase [Chloroflexota bacterium]
MTTTLPRTGPLDVEKMDGEQLKRVVGDLLLKLEVPDQHHFIERMDTEKLRHFVADLLVNINPPKEASTTTFVDADRLREFVTELLTALNVPPHDAYITADVLVAADLRGVDSHGVARLYQYIKRIREGLIQVKPNIQVVHETPVSLRVDADNGLGQVASHFAMTKVIEKAQESGVGMATVFHSNHYGIAGYYAMMALKYHMIGWCFTNTTPLVMPTFGKKVMTGTNPIAVAVPAKDERAWVLDMATSVVPRGKLEVAARRGVQMPTGWAVDKDGAPTNDPAAALAGGAPMPLGGTRELGGHKGYDLAIFVDILSGVLSGAGYGPHLAGFWGTEKASDIGHFFMAFRPDLFMPTGEFRDRMDDMIHELKDCPPVRGADRVMVAGQPEDEATEHHKITGVPLDAKTAQSLRTLSEELGVQFPGK